jgi:mRNA-degrading endonuclease RelE of RelBE toxin-antitoxin system
LAFVIEYSPDAEDHLRALSARQRSTVLDEVDRQSLNEPDVETRTRKPMRPNPVAPWELRIDDLRVYYDIEYDPARKVLIRAVGVKTRNLVRIGGEEIQL